jgi:hypothetical protein
MSNLHVDWAATLIENISLICDFFLLEHFVWNFINMNFPIRYFIILWYGTNGESELNFL